jgi:phytoene dehydrogenase-like protein
MTAVIVVGGGLAGLVAARRMAAAGYEVTLLEEQPAPGGRVQSRRRDGFVLDRGFQVLFDSYPAVQRDLDLAALDARPFDPGAVLVGESGRSVYGDPRRAPGLLPATLLSPAIPLRDSWRLFRLQRGLRGRGMNELFDGASQSIAAYLDEWGLSPATIEAFLGPFFRGITLEPSLGTDAGVFRAVFATLASGRAVLPAEGMGAIPAHLADSARRAGAKIETDRAVSDVTPSGDGVTVTTTSETLTADAAVVATDPPTARSLTGISGIPTTGRGCVTVYASLPRGSAPDLGARLLLNAEETGPNHVAPLSRVAPEYAPDGRDLYSATFLEDQARDDEELLATLRAALERWYPEARFESLSLVAVDRIEFAQFVQPPGFRANLPAIDAPDGPLFLAGEYTRWSSIQGAMESGHRAAEAVAESI